MKVQHLLDSDEDPSANEYEAITCPACARIHLINRRTGKLLGKRTNSTQRAPAATAPTTFARAMPRDRTDQPPGNTINSPAIDGWWTPQRNLNTPALSAGNARVGRWPRCTVKLKS